MKDQLLRSIEIKLAMQYPADQRERIMQTIISCLNDYDVSKKTTDMTVRHEDVNDRILKRYVACLRIDGMSEGTIRQYARELVKLAGTIGKPYTNMTAYDIRFYLGEAKNKGVKNSTLENQRAYIMAFFNWMFNEEMIEKNPCAKVKPIKVEKEIRFPFSQVEIDRMRLACTLPRDRAILETLLSSGIRCEELCNLDIEDVDIDKRILRVRHGKGGKDRVVYISDVAAEHIRLYLASRKDDSSAMFLALKTKDRISTRGVQWLIKTIAEDAKVTNAHPHRFRRTFATEMFRRGMDINMICKLMGHSSVATTQRYIYTADDHLQAEYRKYSA